MSPCRNFWPQCQHLSAVNDYLILILRLVVQIWTGGHESERQSGSDRFSRETSFGALSPRQPLALRFTRQDASEPLRITHVGLLTTRPALGDALRSIESSEKLFRHAAI